MELFCLNEFREAFEKLNSKKAYRGLEREIIDYFFNTEIESLKSGTCLNNDSQTPYIKKRILGSGGYRFYYLLLIKNKKVYLMFVHPKTGPMGAENITDESKAFLYKQVLKSIENNDLYALTQEGEKLKFKPTKLE